MASVSMAAGDNRNLGGVCSRLIYSAYSGFVTRLIPARHLNQPNPGIAPLHLFEQLAHRRGGDAQQIRQLAQRQRPVGHKEQTFQRAGNIGCIVVFRHHFTSKYITSMNSP